MVKADAVGLGVSEPGYGSIIDPARLERTAAPAQTQETANAQAPGDSVAVQAARPASAAGPSTASQLRELGSILRDLGAYADHAANAADGGKPASQDDIGSLVDNAQLSIGMLEALTASD